MDYSPEEELNFSDSEIIEYAEKPYEDMKAGKYKVKFNGTLRCPFCVGKKKQYYKFKDLLLHASGIRQGSSNRSSKQKANHFALAKYLENDLASEVEPNQLLPLAQPRQPVKQTLEQEQVYVWPWMGILVNIVMHAQSKYMLDSDALYKPLEVHIFCDEHNSSTAHATIVMKFKNDWDGFMNVTEFENSFEAKHRGKKDWNVQRRSHSPGSNIYGWCARTDDENADENVLWLVEVQKREKEEALKKILKLKEELDAKQKLEIYGNCRLERQVTGDEARKELIQGFQDVLGAHTNIGIKRMGEIDVKPFQNACKLKYSAGEAEVQPPGHDSMLLVAGASKGPELASILDN
ncbi:hypothetical protein Dsin_028201 [Dipteronia sinensis]|uniref:XS domain-containing protein n=1 Tax=Dipteronia sinensis TaxID=43782 RepID=A0AAD9ZQ47_9ROSI|nr:hypothetical protein Dsin_028201 [Dipteronia sinensis]